ncbi:hypothetical protein B566_EDAN009595 [Ephemera danica]|nr:hypothetical protein B566_EDAN009595 [Ephemera danica]
MIVLVFLSVLALTAADPVAFEDCGFVYQLTQVDVQGCSSIPCHFLLGSHVNVTSRFQTTGVTQSLHDQVYFTVLLIDYPATAIPSKACDSIQGASCPIPTGTVVNHRAEVYVNPSLIPTRAKMEWRMFNEQEKEVLCFRVSVNLDEPPYKANVHNLETRENVLRR